MGHPQPHARTPWQKQMPSGLFVAHYSVSTKMAKACNQLKGTILITGNFSGNAFHFIQNPHLDQDKVTTVLEVSSYENTCKIVS